MIAKRGAAAIAACRAGRHIGERSMRICVFGAGAVGGHIATRLALTGHDVSVVARGEHLAAIKRVGLTLHSGDKVLRAPVQASDQPRDLGVQDVVFCTLKATALPSLAISAGPLLGPKTPVVFAQNGIPWWYGLGLSISRPKPPDLSRLDPGNRLQNALSAKPVIGGIIYSSNEAIGPGVIANGTPNRNTLLIGATDDRSNDSVERLRSALTEAGFQSPPVPDIRVAVWRKLMLNMTASILSLLTRQKATIVRDDKRIGDLFVRLAEEAVAIATAHGINLEGFDPLAHRRNPPDHKPSILQDYERGRPLELEALLVTPHAFGRAAGIDTPHLDSVVALAIRLGMDAGLYYPSPDVA